MSEVRRQEDAPTGFMKDITTFDVPNGLGLIIKDENKSDNICRIQPTVGGISIYLFGPNTRGYGNGAVTKGRYPIKCTIPGEVSNEYMPTVITEYLRICIPCTEEYVCKMYDQFSDEINHVILARGKMDSRGELPSEFCDTCPEVWLYFGRKVAWAPPTRKSTPHSAVSAWHEDIYTKVFYDYWYPLDLETKKLTPDQNAEFFSMILNDKIKPDVAISQMERQKITNQWETYNSYVKTLIKHNILPEKIHGMKHYQALLQYGGTQYLTSGIFRSQHFQTFLQKVEPIFGGTMRLHDHVFSGWPEIHLERCETRDRLFKLMERWPKTDRMKDLFEKSIAQGVSMNAIVKWNIKTSDELEHLYTISKIFSKENGKHLTADYIPPKIDLPDGYAWANAKTFNELSDLYKNCISTFGSYEGKICNGMAHVVYRIDPKNNLDGCGDQKMKARYGYGICALIEYDKDEKIWTCKEQRAWGNQDPHPEYAKTINSIVRNVNERMPGIHAVVVQKDQDKDITSEIQRYIKENEDTSHYVYARDPLKDVCKILQQSKDKTNLTTKEHRLER